MALTPSPSPQRSCPYGFLAEYLTYTKAQESPEDFHMWCGLALLSATLGRNVWIDRGYFKLYPNLFVCLVAESGKLHKSTAINMGLHLLREANPEHNFFAEKITPEALIGYLAKQSKACGKSVATISASEFAVFFGKSIHDPSLLQLLTDFYDNPDKRSYDTKSRGLEICENISINMLAGSTPEWIRTSLPEDTVGGGFTSRLLMIYRTESEKQRVAFPEELAGKDLYVAKDNCIQDLRSISKLHGAFRLTVAARDYFKDWYDLQTDAVNNAPPGLRGYMSRKGDYIMKIAMLISANMSSNLVITDQHLEFARSYVTEEEKPMTEVLRELSKGDIGRFIDKVKAFLISHRMQTPGVPRSELIRAFRHSMSMQDMDTVISTLIASGEVISVKDPNGSNRVYYGWSGD